jgi:hypothetical protein
MRLVSFIERDLEDLARAESIDNGKPPPLAACDGHSACRFVPSVFYATAAMHTANESHETRRPGDQLHTSATARGCRLYLAVEPAAVSLHMEDRTRDRGGMHGCREAKRSDSDDGLSSI